MAKTAITMFLWLIAVSVYAQHSAGLPGIQITNTQSFVDDVLCQIATWMFWILIALSVVFVLWAAFKYLTSAGEEENIRKANRTIAYAAVAIIVALIARGFPLIVATLFPSQTLPLSESDLCP